MTTFSNALPRPTESELELLRILWEKEPATVREIFDALNRERPSGYTTVLKLLQIMTTKGLVVRDEANRAHVYRAAMSQDAMQSKLLKDLSVRLFAGSAAQLALHALAMDPRANRSWMRFAHYSTREKQTGVSGKLSPSPFDCGTGPLNRLTFQTICVLDDLLIRKEKP